MKKVTLTLLSILTLCVCLFAAENASACRIPKSELYGSWVFIKTPSGGVYQRKWVGEAPLQSRVPLEDTGGEFVKFMPSTGLDGIIQNSNLIIQATDVQNNTLGSTFSSKILQGNGDGSKWYADIVPVTGNNVWRVTDSYSGAPVWDSNPFWAVQYSVKNSCGTRVPMRVHFYVMH